MMKLGNEGIKTAVTNVLHMLRKAETAMDTGGGTGDIKITRRERL